MDNAPNLEEWFRDLYLMVREGIEPKKAAAKVEALIEWCKLCLSLDQMMPGRDLGGVTLIKLVIKEDTKVPNRAVIVATGLMKKAKVVTFHSGPLNADLFASFLRRGHAKTLEWKPDKPWEPKVADEDEVSLPSLMDL